MIGVWPLQLKSFGRQVEAVELPLSVPFMLLVELEL
jgi:hypothetical protein